MNDTSQPSAPPIQEPGERTRLAISDRGVRFIAGFEGFRGRLYSDPLGHCTIGYGHLVHRGRCNGSEPAEFRRGITEDRGRDLLRSDLRPREQCVDDGITVPLKQHQFDALVSFVFNVGCGAFMNSALRKKLNRGDYDSVPDELMHWTNNGLPGLVRRRRAEGRLFKDRRYE